MKSKYELLNDEAINALRLMREAVDANELAIMEYYDGEVRRLLAEMRAEVRR